MIRMILSAALLLLARPQAPAMNFFITSAGPGNGAALGGLEGADAHCAALAKAAGSAITTWRAYLSAKAADGKPAVNAKDRIGNGPWFNQAGVQGAANVADLESDNNKPGKGAGRPENGRPEN